LGDADRSQKGTDLLRVQVQALPKLQDFLFFQPASRDDLLDLVDGPKWIAISSALDSEQLGRRAAVGRERLLRTHPLVELDQRHTLPGDRGGIADRQPCVETFLHVFPPDLIAWFVDQGAKMLAKVAQMDFLAVQVRLGQHVLLGLKVLTIAL
jgi:hypothetical protein